MPCDCGESFKRKFHGEIRLHTGVQDGMPSGVSTP